MITDTYLETVSPSDNGETVICKIKYTEDGNVNTIKIPIAYSFYSDAGFPHAVDNPLPLDNVNFKKLISMSKLTVAIKKGLDLLGFAVCSKRGLTDKLVHKGFDKKTSEKAAQYLSDNGFIDETSQAESYVVDMANKKLYGKTRIKNELFKKGYTQDIINIVLETSGVDFEKICRERIETTMRIEDFSDKKTASKNVNALLRYGFTFTEIKNALRSFS